MNYLNRRDAVRVLLQDRGELLVIAGLGSAAYDLAACSDSPADFPLWGAMGGTLMMGLGLALAQPARNVLVLTGDGDMLMGMGSLATAALQNPPNLRVVILDNGQFGETGRQATHTATVTDLAAVAHGCGIANVRTITQPEALVDLRADLHSHQGLLFALLKISDEAVPRVLPPRDGPYLTHRFRAGLLGDRAAMEA